MGFYDQQIFARFYDCVMDRPHWAEHRKRQLADVAGDVLEIGVGTGLNLPHYPPNVGRITTVDPNTGMNKRLRRRIDQTGIDVDIHAISGESLPFDDATFDCAVSTITLCSIPNVKRAVAELHRVLRPGGRMFFLEHGLSPDTKVAKWQRRLNGIQRLFAGGCTLTLDVPALLATQPFDDVTIDNFYMAKTPRTHGYMYEGVARKADTS